MNMMVYTIFVIFYMVFVWTWICQFDLCIIFVVVVEKKCLDMIEFI